MTDEQKKEYTLKISQANRSEIIVLIFEMADIYLSEAIKSVDAGNEKLLKASCDHASACIEHLLDALDFSYKLAFPLMRVYMYCNKEVILAGVKRDPEGLITVRRLLIKLKEAFEEVARKDDSKSVMQNSQTVYAGLTYGKKSLNENLEDEGARRGYRV